MSELGHHLGERNHRKRSSRAANYHTCRNCGIDAGKKERKKEKSIGRERETERKRESMTHAGGKIDEEDSKTALE